MRVFTDAELEAAVPAATDGLQPRTDCMVLCFAFGGFCCSNVRPPGNKGGCFPTFGFDDAIGVVEGGHLSDVGGFFQPFDGAVPPSAGGAFLTLGAPSNGARSPSTGAGYLPLCVFSIVAGGLDGASLSCGGACFGCLGGSFGGAFAGC